MRKKSVMVTWLWNLIQGDFAQNPTAWMDLAITVLGIVLSPVAWFTSKCLEGKAAKREAKDAHDVRVVLSSGKEYELGNMSKGSSIGFMFMEKAIMCEDGYADIRITWSLPGESGERHSVTKPSPQYLH